MKKQKTPAEAHGPTCEKIQISSMGTGPVEKYKQVSMAELEVWMKGGVVNILWSVCFL